MKETLFNFLISIMEVIGIIFTLREWKLKEAKDNELGD